MANTILAALKSGSFSAVPGVARSTNSGTSWSQAYTYGSNIMGICNTPTGLYAISYNGHLINSTNDGATWADLGQINAGATQCSDIGYIGNNTLVVGNGAASTSAYISTNMGTSWSALVSSPNRIYKVLDMGGGKAVLLGSNGTSSGYEYKTTNYGSSWSSVANIGNTQVRDAVHLGSGVVLICGGDDAITPANQIYRSTDYGDNWSLVNDLGADWWGISIGYVPGTNYALCTLQAVNVENDNNKYLYRSSDSGLNWTSVGNQGAMALYGSTDGKSYSGRTAGLCPVIAAASIEVSSDYGDTWSTTTGYDPTRFLEVTPFASNRPTQLDYRFLKTPAISGLEDGGSHTIQIKVGSGVVRDTNGLSLTGLTSVVIEDHVVTTSDMTSKSITLSQSTSDPNKVALTVYGGLPQNIGTDYTGTSTMVTWNGMGLDGVIAAGEEVRLVYPS